MQRSICDSWAFLKNRFANAVTISKISGFHLATGIASPGVTRWLIAAQSRKTTHFTKLLGLVIRHNGIPRGSLLGPRNFRP